MQANVDLEMQNSVNNDSGVQMNPMRPNVDLDTTRPFAVNPQYNPDGNPAAASAPPSVFSQYSAVPTVSPSAPPAPVVPVDPSTNFAALSSPNSCPVVEAVPVTVEAVAVGDDNSKSIM